MVTTSAHRLLAARPRTRTLLDIAISCAVFAGSLLLISHGNVVVSGPGASLHPIHSAERGLDWISGVLAACSTLPVVAWRRSPFGVFVGTTAAGILLVLLHYPLDVLLGPAAALYLLASSRERHHPWTRRTTVTVIALLAAYLVATAATRPAFPSIGLFPTPVAWALAWFAGDRSRLRREHIADLRERAIRAEREAERERLLAAAEERTRIARDLHDSAGHAISVIAVRAGAARLGHDRNPERSRAALQAIEDLARRTAEEIDTIVGTLREGAPHVPSSPGVEAPPGLASLDTLIAHHTAAGHRITLDASGTPRPLATAADQAAYRILQESLTNASRHGTGGARIELAYREAAVELTVTNPAPSENGSRLGGGHGLIGMRERAAMLGGTLDAGRAGGAFRVHARIPYGGGRR
ncbi:sensor histidine kinase [Actinomadura sp. SCN-SB]|uniref:sensor histidine kinase n=1 Tax=Actinomadura sp. SCN-SB TaxID=3373092 RepID=UPI003750B9AA